MSRSNGTSGKVVAAVDPVMHEWRVAENFARRFSEVMETIVRRETLAAGYKDDMKTRGEHWVRVISPDNREHYILDNNKTPEIEVIPGNVKYDGTICSVFDVKKNELHVFRART